MSTLSNQLLPETFYETISECLWAQIVSNYNDTTKIIMDIIADIVYIVFLYAGRL